MMYALFAVYRILYTHSYIDITLHFPRHFVSGQKNRGSGFAPLPRL